MTLYNDTMTMDDFEKEFMAARGFKAMWLGCGYEEGAAGGENEDKFVVYGRGENTSSAGVDAGTIAYTAIYDSEGNLLDLRYNDYVSGRTIGSDTEENLFDKDYDGATPAKARMFIWANNVPQSLAKDITISFE